MLYISWFRLFQGSSLFQFTLGTCWAKCFGMCYLATFQLCKFTLQRPTANISRPSNSLDRPGFKRVEVPLTFDAEFFDILYGDVINLDALQIAQQKAVVGGINALSTRLVRLAQYVRFSAHCKICWQFAGLVPRNSKTRSPTCTDGGNSLKSTFRHRYSSRTMKRIMDLETVLLQLNSLTGFRMKWWSEG